LAALAVGDQGAIDRDDWTVFRRTGVAHLMAISGLHVTMFAWIAGAVVGGLWRRSTRLTLWHPAPRAARWGGLCAAACYALLAGWGVPAQRTLAMLAAVVLLQSLGRRWPTALILLAAAGVVALGDPWALLQPGFWLSFGAVALLLASAPTADGEATPQPSGAARRLAHAAAGGLRTQAVVTAGLAPLTLLCFQQVSVVGFVANIVAIPLVTLLVTPLAVAGVAVPALWSAAALLLQGLDGVLTALSAWPGAVWTAPAAPAWAAAAGLLGGALAVLPLPWPLRWLALPLMLPLALPPVAAPPVGRFELVALDVGQGSAVLVRTHGRLLVYDAGPAFAPGVDAGSRVLLPVLQARGERVVDLMMLSHRDEDHVGGAAAVLAGVPVRALSSSLEAGHPLLAGSVAPHTRCAAGQRWTWDGVAFEVLQPAAAADPAARPNTLSCVLRVRDAGGRSALLTGDLEAAQERAIVQALGDRLRSDLMMVPHHGSRTSSTGVLLDAVQPSTAFVQAGYRSRFGHPAADVLERYAQRGITLQRSDRCGAWTWSGDGPGRCERQSERRYWHHGG
ncbi:MAG: DNA internalization-related competence protein ComEC/Rec2, partial [Rubrivivax sp.]